MIFKKLILVGDAPPFCGAGSVLGWFHLQTFFCLVLFCFFLSNQWIWLVGSKNGRCFPAIELEINKEPHSDLFCFFGSFYDAVRVSRRRRTHRRPLFSLFARVSKWKVDFVFGGQFLTSVADIKHAHTHTLTYTPTIVWWANIEFWDANTHTHDFSAPFTFYSSSRPLREKKNK